MEEMNNLSEEESDLRKALQYEVLNIVLQQDATSGMRTTTGAVRALTELVWQYMHNAMIPDLVAFSNHAKSRTISTDDVGLILRKLPDKLDQFQSQFPGSNNSRAPGSTTTTMRRLKTGRSPSVSPTPLSRKRPLSPVSTVSAVSASTLHYDRDRNREREYQDLLLASSDEDELPVDTTVVPPPATKRQNELEKDSFSSEDDKDNQSITVPMNAKAAVRRLSTTTTTSAYQRARQVLQDMTPPSPMVVSKNIASIHTTSPLSGKDDAAKKSNHSLSPNTEDDDASILPTTNSTGMKRKAVLDEDDDDHDHDDSCIHDSKVESSLKDQTTPPQFNRTSDGPPLSLPGPTTSSILSLRTTQSNEREHKEPPKSQVADILANMTYDSGPESNDQMEDAEVIHDE